jgi:thioredoxin reductase
MNVDVAIVGAGPYGLALAAHLRSVGVDHIIFGRPMDLWQHHMPQGMFLKSDGFASNLYDPDGAYPLSRFCRDHSIDYSDDRLPVRLDTFVDYGLAFRDRYAPGLKDILVDTLSGDNNSFLLDLEDGSKVRARRVVVATGIGHFRYIPPPLDSLSTEYVSHSYDHHDLSSLVGRRIAVIGSGASAIDTAGLLAERGCQVQLICRSERLVFASPPPATRSLWTRFMYPHSGLGPGLRSRLCTDAPLLFHFMPKGFRQEVVRRHLGPAAGWPMRNKVIGRVPVFCGHELTSATTVDGSVLLQFRNPRGETVDIRVDHVISATGYRVDIRKLHYLDKSLLARLNHLNQTPVLSTRFESSIDGLFFTGPIAANSFGPLMRFALGARFASRRLLPILSHPSRSKSRDLKQSKKAGLDIEADRQ